MQCAGCHFDAPPDFLFCPKCGAELRPVCPSCGFRSSPEFTFCPGCGRRVGAADPAPATNPPAPPTTAPSPETAAPPAPATTAPSLGTAAPPAPPTTAPSLGSAPGGAAPPGARAPAPRTVPSLGTPGSTPAASEPRAEAERRLATVLFADLSGFTALSETMDPEDVRSVQRDLFREMTTCLERFGGSIEKFAGDAVMAVFGAPVTHEDDPVRALAAALELHEGVRALGVQWEERLGHRLALHVGVNTGTVVAGALGLYGGDAYVVTGDTVNVAARLQSAAGPGETFVGDATWFLTQHAFEFDGSTEVSLKGKSRPIRVHRLLRARSAPEASARHGVAAELAGRETELAALDAALGRMLEGRAQVVSVVGDAGVGKTRLVDEFLSARSESLERADASVRRTVCPAHGEQPFGVIAALVREHYGIDERDSLETASAKALEGMSRLGASVDERARLEPVLGPLLGLVEAGDGLQLEPEQLERQIVLAVRTLCELQLARGPLLLVVEDLHWADAASVELLAYLAERGAGRKLLMVHTFRSWPGASALQGERAEHLHLRLGALDRKAAMEMLDGMLGGGDVPAGLREQMLERAEGHPLFLEELVRGLLASGALVRTENGLGAAQGTGLPTSLPPSIHALMLARLDRLSPAARRAAQEAAVLGVTFEQELLHDVASDPGAVADALAELVQAELLEVLGGTPEGDGSRGGGRFRFTHSLVQEVVYESLLRTRRSALHGAVGRALEARRTQEPGGERIEDLTRLGHHFSLSEERERGARYLIAAGDGARAVHAHEDAVRHYRRALEALGAEGPPRPERLQAEERVADLVGAGGGRDEAIEIYRRLLEAHRGAGDPTGEARILRKTGQLLWEGGDRSTALEHFQQGLERLDGEEGESIERAHLYQAMGRLAFRGGDHERAAEWAARALAYALALSGAGSEQVDVETEREAALALAHAHNTLGISLARMERPREAVEQIRRSIGVAEAQQLWQAACRAYANLGVLYCSLDPPSAIATCREGLALSEKIGDLGLQSQLHANLAVAYCSLTDRCDDEGLQQAEAAVELDRQLGRLDHMAVPLIVLGQIHQCSGAFQQALRYYREALELAELVREPQLLFPCYDGIATVHLDLGDQAEAERYLLEAERVCQEAGLQPESLMVLPFLS